LTVRQADLKGLENVHDERAIEPLASIAFGQGEDREAALAALKAYGPAAEDAVLKNVRGATPETLPGIISVLTDVGTLKKSGKYLQGIMKRLPPEQQLQVRTALKTIGTREQKPKATK
jgi:hypothetical protein